MGLEAIDGCCFPITWTRRIVLRTSISIPMSLGQFRHVGHLVMTPTSRGRPSLVDLALVARRDPRGIEVEVLGDVAGQLSVAVETHCTRVLGSEIWGTIRYKVSSIPHDQGHRSPIRGVAEGGFKMETPAGDPYC
jgi:hypothetical protein